MTLIILGFLALTTNPEWKALQCSGEPVGGRYVNYAEGFSVGMPVGLNGKRGQAAGPERGVSIPLSANCLGVVVVYGEPNSAEWANTAVAVAQTAGYALTDIGSASRLSNRALVLSHAAELWRAAEFGSLGYRRGSGRNRERVARF